MYQPNSFKEAPGEPGQQTAYRTVCSCLHFCSEDSIRAGLDSPAALPQRSRVHRRPEPLELQLGRPAIQREEKRHPGRGSADHALSRATLCRLQVSVADGHAMIGQAIADYMSSLFGSDSDRAAAGQKIADAAPCRHSSEGPRRKQRVSAARERSVCSATPR